MNRQWKVVRHGVSNRRVNLLIPVLGMTTGMLMVFFFTSTIVTDGGTVEHRSDIYKAGEDVDSEMKCKPVNHILFLKIHKCASTTVQNVFLRYGYKHNLIFALPSGANYLGNPQPFHTGMLWRPLVPHNGKVDIFALHSRLNPPEHAKVLYDDSIWVTILREPTSLYESLFNFYHMQNAFMFTLDEFKEKSLEELSSFPRYGGKLGRNQMLFDLGYAENLSVPALNQAIDDLDERFHLVMISEFIDESFILLRHLLCWSLHDIVVFTKNARREEVKPKMDTQTIWTLRDLNSADVLLYEHFVAKHKTAVSNFGVKRMADEVAELRGLRDEYYEECGVKEVNGKDESLRFKEYSNLVSGLSTNNNTDFNCLMMTMPELTLVNTVRDHQKKIMGVA